MTTVVATASDFQSAPCIDPATIPLAPPAPQITADASENLRALRQSLEEWQSYRLVVVARLNSECATQVPAVQSPADCEIGPLENAWDDRQLTGSPAEDSMQLAAALRYVRLSATDIRNRLVQCGTPSENGT